MIHWDKSIVYSDYREYAIAIFMRDGRVEVVPVDSMEELVKWMDDVRKGIVEMEPDVSCASIHIRRIYVAVGFFNPEPWVSIDALYFPTKGLIEP